MPNKSALLASAQALVNANESASANSTNKPATKPAPKPAAKPATQPVAKAAAKPATQPRNTSRRAAPAASTPKAATPRSPSSNKPASPASTIAKIATEVIAQAQPASSEMDQVIEKAAQSPKLREKAPAKTAEKPAKVAQKPEKSAKKSAKKAKLIRDSFTFPADDYALIAATKQRVLSAGVEVKKSELIRAGLTALAAMDTAQLLALVQGLEKIKTGRPSK